MNRNLSIVFSKLPARLIAVACISFLSALSVSADTATNAPALTGAGLPDTGASILRVFGALALVIGIFLGGVWLFRNWQRFTVRKNGAPKLNVLEVKALGQRQTIYVVGYEQQRMLLAASPAGITLLSHLPEAGEIKAETVAAPTAPAGPAPRMSFAEAFQQVLQRK